MICQLLTGLVALHVTAHAFAPAPTPLVGFGPSVLCGRVDSDPDGWRAFGSASVYRDVDTRLCEFKSGAVRYAYSLYGLNMCLRGVPGALQVFGANSVLNASPSGFRIVLTIPSLPGGARKLLSLLRGTPSRGDTASAHSGCHTVALSWIGDEGGNTGTTMPGATGWRVGKIEGSRANSDGDRDDKEGTMVVLEATVDTSDCGFGISEGGRDVRPQYFVSLQGLRGAWHGQGTQVVQAPTSTGFSVTIVAPASLFARVASNHNPHNVGALNMARLAEAMEWTVSWVGLVRVRDAGHPVSWMPGAVHKGIVATFDSSGSGLTVEMDNQVAPTQTMPLPPPAYAVSIEIPQRIPSILAVIVAGGAVSLFQPDAHGATVYIQLAPAPKTALAMLSSRVQAAASRPSARNIALSVFGALSGVHNVAAAVAAMAGQQQWRIRYAGYAYRDCTLSHWGSFSACSVSCGANDYNGIRVRHRVIELHGGGRGGRSCRTLLNGTDAPALVQPDLQGKKCDARWRRPCPRSECRLSAWGPWGPCSASCGLNGRSVSARVPLAPVGSSHGPLRSRVIEMKAIAQVCAKQKQLLSRYRNCSAVECPVDCVVGRWQPWTPCSAAPHACGAAGIGQRYRFRTVLRKARAGGSCPPLTESRSCHTQHVAQCLGSGRSRLCGAAHPPLGQNDGRAFMAAWRSMGSDATYVDVDAAMCGFAHLNTTLANAPPTRVQWIPTLSQADSAPFFGSLLGVATVMQLPPPLTGSSAAAHSSGTRLEGGSDMWNHGFRYIVRLPGIGWHLRRFALRYRWRVHWLGESGANAGSTAPGRSKWRLCSSCSPKFDNVDGTKSKTLVIDVPTSAARWEPGGSETDARNEDFMPRRPVYLAVLRGTRGAMATRGANVVHAPTLTGFRVYVTVLGTIEGDKASLSDDQKIREHSALAAAAETNQWHISWIALPPGESTVSVKKTSSGQNVNLLSTIVVATQTCKDEVHGAQCGFGSRGFEADRRTTLRHYGVLATRFKKSIERNVRTQKLSALRTASLHRVAKSEAHEKAAAAYGVYVTNGVTNEVRFVPPRGRFTTTPVLVISLVVGSGAWSGSNGLAAGALSFDRLSPRGFRAVIGRPNGPVAMARVAAVGPRKMVVHTGFRAAAAEAKRSTRGVHGDGQHLSGAAERAAKASAAMFVEAVRQRWSVAYVAHAPDDCVVSDWGAWGSCSSKCGGGLRHRARDVLRRPMPRRFGIGGAVVNACPPKGMALRMQRTCATNPCVRQGLQRLCGMSTTPAVVSNILSRHEAVKGAHWKLLGLASGALYADITTTLCRFSCDENDGYKSASFVASLSTAEPCNEARLWELQLSSAPGRSGTGVGAPLLQYSTSGDGCGGRKIRVMLAHPRLRGTALLQAAARGRWSINWLGASGEGTGISTPYRTGWHRLPMPLYTNALASTFAPVLSPIIAADVPLSGARDNHVILASLVSPAACIGAALGMGLRGGGAAVAMLHVVEPQPPQPRQLRVILSVSRRFIPMQGIVARGPGGIAAAAATVGAREAERCGWHVAWIATPPSAPQRSGQGDEYARVGAAIAALHRRTGVAREHHDRHTGTDTAASLITLHVDTQSLGLRTQRPVYLATMLHTRPPRLAKKAHSTNTVTLAVNDMWPEALVGGGAMLCGGSAKGFDMLLSTVEVQRTAMTAVISAMPDRQSWRIAYVAIEAVLCSVSVWGAWSACDHDCNAVKNTSLLDRRRWGGVSCYQVRARKAAGVARGCVIPILHQARICRSQSAPRVSMLRRQSTSHDMAVSTAPVTAAKTTAVATTPIPDLSFSRVQREIAARQPTRMPTPSAQTRSEQWRRRGLVLILTCVCVLYVRIAMRWACRVLLPGGDSSRSAGPAPVGMGHDAVAWHKSLKQGGATVNQGNTMQSYMQYQSDLSHHHLQQQQWQHTALEMHSVSVRRFHS